MIMNTTLNSLLRNVKVIVSRSIISHARCYTTCDCYLKRLVLVCFFGVEAWYGGLDHLLSPESRSSDQESPSG